MSHSPCFGWFRSDEGKGAESTGHAPRDTDAERDAQPLFTRCGVRSTYTGSEVSIMKILLQIGLAVVLFGALGGCVYGPGYARGGGYYYDGGPRYDYSPGYYGYEYAPRYYGYGYAYPSVSIGLRYRDYGRTHGHQHGHRWHGDDGRR